MIICCGEALIDMVPVRGKVEAFSPLPGGSPYNTAVAIGRLGVPVKFLGRISTDYFGEILMKRLQKSRVDEEFVKRTDQNSSLAFVRQEKGKEPDYLFYTEGSADRSLLPEDLPAKLPPETKCIMFGSISMTMEPIATTIESLVLREGTRRGMDQMEVSPVISFDPNIRPFMIKDRLLYMGKFEKWIAASTIAKISSEDSEFLYPKMEPEKALRKLLAMGPWLAVCTLGTKGALALLRRNDGSVVRASAPAIAVTVSDTVGAGDAFHGAFLSWLEINGKMSRSALPNLSETDLYNAVCFANKAASIACSRPGMDPPTRKEVESLKVPEAKSADKPASKPAAKSAAGAKPKATTEKKGVKKK